MHPATEAIQSGGDRPTCRTRAAVGADVQVARRRRWIARGRTSIVRSKILEVAALDADIDMGDGVADDNREIDPLALRKPVLRLAVLRSRDAQSCPSKAKADSKILGICSREEHGHAASVRPIIARAVYLRTAVRRVLERIDLKTYERRVRGGIGDREQGR